MITRGTITIKRNLKTPRAKKHNRANEDRLLKMLIALTEELEARQPSHYRAELLPNGYVRVFDYGTKWSALYTPAGEFHSGEISIPFVEVMK